MEISLGRKINLGNYESSEFRVALNSDDVPAQEVELDEESETLHHHLNRIHFLCFRELNIWQFRNNSITLNEAKENISNFKKFYKIEDDD